MLKKLASLTTIAKEFFTRRNPRAQNLKPYYRMISVGASMLEEGKWEVDFFLSGSAKNPHAFCPLSPRRISEVLKKHLGEDAPALQQHDRNHFILLAANRQKARHLAMRLVHIFGQEGIPPMVDEMHRFKPKP
ncbi:MAG: hypothetical protein ACAH80_11345 [Alphaproteobacteria bacterium]